MLRLRLISITACLLPVTGCLSNLVDRITGNETVVMEGVYDGEVVESSPIIAAPKSLRAIPTPKEIADPPAELGPPPKKMPPAKPIPAEPSSLKKKE